MSLKDLLFSFQGRIRRSLWWTVQIAIVAIGFVLVMTVGLIGAAIGDASEGAKTAGEIVFGLFLIFAIPIAAWINLATGVKRLHDQGQSGWLMLLTLIPYLGGLFGLICLGCLDGNPRSNRYGPSPKYPESVATTFS